MRPPLATGKVKCITVGKFVLRRKNLLHDLKTATLIISFFDGTLKLNPGIAGVGGVICNANGDCMVSYEWGLGHLSNNRAEALALYQGLVQLSKLGIDTAHIFGDSTVVIGLMAQNKYLPNVLLHLSISRCKNLGQSFITLTFCHILRSFNKDADLLANRACHRALGSLRCYNEESHQYLP